MRIISGKHRGRRIELARKATQVRPTSGMAREALFNILCHGKYAQQMPIAGQQVLDVFCGSGAFGLEALSRGAAHVTFIDRSRDSLESVRGNAERYGEIQTTSFSRVDATQLPSATRTFGLVFIDPPYNEIKVVLPTLKSLRERGWLAQGAVIIVEHEARQEWEVPPEFELLDERRYGRAMLKFLTVAE